MYYYMSLCNIPFVTSCLKPKHRFALNFVWMFLWWAPTKFDKLGMQHILSWLLPFVKHYNTQHVMHFFGWKSFLLYLSDSTAT